MLYHLVEWLKSLDIYFPGANLFKYITFRSAACIITALIIAFWVGPAIIRRLQKKQIGETIRDLGLEGQLAKKGTPTMGGLIIIISILVPVLLFCNLTSVYTILLIITTLLLGTIGFLDDSIKVFKKDKEGLKGKYKVFGDNAVRARPRTGTSIHCPESSCSQCRIPHILPDSRIRKNNPAHLQILSGQQS